MTLSKTHCTLKKPPSMMALQPLNIIMFLKILLSATLKSPQALLMHPENVCVSILNNPLIANHQSVILGLGGVCVGVYVCVCVCVCVFDTLIKILNVGLQLDHIKPNDLT